jgi:hypothetical protein
VVVRQAPIGQEDLGDGLPVPLDVLEKTFRVDRPRRGERRPLAALEGGHLGSPPVGSANPPPILTENTVLAASGAFSVTCAEQPVISAVSSWVGIWLLGRVSGVAVNGDYQLTQVAVSW